MAGIHFTEAAQTYLAELLSKQDTTGVGIRVFITQDRKSTRLNSSHVKISYAVFCLKKKNKTGWESARATSDATLVPLFFLFLLACWWQNVFRQKLRHRPLQSGSSEMWIVQHVQPGA